jgi:hypothetical protein
LKLLILSLLIDMRWGLLKGRLLAETAETVIGDRREIRLLKRLLKGLVKGLLKGLLYLLVTALSKKCLPVQLVFLEAFDVQE